MIVGVPILGHIMVNASLICESLQKRGLLLNEIVRSLETRNRGYEKNSCSFQLSMKF